MPELSTGACVLGAALVIESGNLDGTGLLRKMPAPKRGQSFMHESFVGRSADYFLTSPRPGFGTCSFVVEFGCD